MATRADIMRKLHDEDGMSYERIGQLYGISRQRVHQILTAPPKDHFHPMAVQKVRYVGLREWMLENRITLSKLDELCGTSRLASSVNLGCNFRKSTIDAILKVTGLTYEECFREETI